ncbi:MAG TPA: amidohydrolase family protein [Chthonomonadales bacterium]|nr:amidohydrolase family protein [Chthonomonadales bacterium]
MIVDVHTHAFRYPDHISEAFLREAEIARGRSIDLTIEETAYAQAMAPVDKAIVFGLKARHVGIVVPDEFIARFVTSAPDKLIGFCCVDPNEEGCIEYFEHAIDALKLRGIKLAPMYANFSPLDSRLDPVYERAQRDGLPVLAHTGTTFCRYAPLEYTRPILIDSLAMRFPRLKFIMAHLGHPWEAETLVVIRKHPNVWADLSALYYRPWQLYNSLALAQEYGVMGKILFGSDYPFATPAESIEGLYGLNDMVEGTSLPRISRVHLDEIIHRDSLALLFGEAR